MGLGAHCDLQIKHFFCHVVKKKKEKKKCPWNGDSSGAGHVHTTVRHGFASALIGCKLLHETLKPSDLPTRPTPLYFPIMPSASGGDGGVWGKPVLLKQGSLCLPGDIFGCRSQGGKVLRASSRPKSGMLLK